MIDWDCSLSRPKSLGGQKEHYHILYGSFSLSKWRNLSHQLGFLLPAGDVRWLWTWGKRNQTFNRLVVEMVQTRKGPHWLMVSSVFNRRKPFVRIRNGACSNSRRRWHRCKGRDRFQVDRLWTEPLWGNKVNHDGFGQTFALSLLKSSPQICSHVFLFTNNRGHHPLNPYF